MAADWFLPLDEVGLRCLTEANGVNVSYPLLGKTRANIMRNPNVSLATAVTVPRKKGIQLRGTAVIYERGPIYDEVCSRLQRLGTELALRSVVAVSVTSAFLLDPGPDSGKQVFAGATASQGG